MLDHPFNHAKSDLKWLEYSICYIPAIYSTISPYTASVEHGKTGWLVDNQTEAWVQAILIARCSRLTAPATTAPMGRRSSRSMRAGRLLRTRLRRAG